LTPHKIDFQFDAPRGQFVAQPREFCKADFMDHSKKMAEALLLAIFKNGPYWARTSDLLRVMQAR
jgi:hypothetical protein